MTEAHTPDDGILKKLEAILARAERGSTANEREVAMAKAARLMAKHHVTAADVKGAGAGYQVHEHDADGPYPAEMTHAMGIVQGYFFVRLTRRGWVDVHQQTGKQRTGHTLYVYGTTINITVALHVYKFVSRAMHDAWAAWCKDINVDPALARGQADFYGAMRRGIEVRIKEARRQLEDELGLVLVDDPALTEFMEQKAGELALVEAPQADGLYGASMAGWKAGLATHIHPAMAAGETTPALPPEGS